MKPHEQTWVAYERGEGPSGEVQYEIQTVGLPSETVIPPAEMSEAVARLVARAPAMARLLVLTMDDICDEENEHWQEIRRTLLKAGVIP